MFRVKVYPLPEVASRFSGGVATATPAPESGHPFVNIPYSEIEENALKTIVDFAGINSSMAPVGLPRTFEPFVDAGEYYFPLDGFSRHLIEMFPDAMNLASKEEFDTAADYVVGGTMNCLQYCRKHDLALVIRW